MKKICLLGFAFLLIAGVLLFAGGKKEAAGGFPDHPADKPMKAAVDMGFVPFAYLTPKGEPEGFAVDLANALADELDRPGVEIIDVEWSGIFAALFSKKVEYIVAPTNVRKERAEQMDFTEPYMDTAELIAVNKKDKKNITKLEDLKGKTIGVNTGSSGHSWLTDNQAKWGFKIDEYDGMPAAAQAVQVGRIDGVIGARDAVGHYATDKPELVSAILILTGEQYALPLRKGDAYRDVLEEALVKLKENGTLVELYKKWFGDDPGADSAVKTIYPGVGTPGMPGYKE
ncbi:Membrane-bound lytic murein transglycosylase F [subsurface metagenome]